MDLKVIFQTGDLLYCHVRGKTQCCFQNEECGKSMTEANDQMINKSITFLGDKKKYLTNLVDKLGYDACYPIKGYDASVCEKDCKRREKSPFAKNCTANDGMFKCCIRYTTQVKVALGL